MTQQNIERSVANGGLFPSGNMTPEQVITALLKFMWRQQRVIVVTMAAAMFLSVTYLLVVRSTFTAQTTIIIDARRSLTFQPRNTTNDAPLDAPAVESQVEVIRSDNIARSVIKQLELTKDKEFTRYGGGLLGNLLYFGYELFGWEDSSTEPSVNRRALREFARNLAVKRVGSTYVIEITYRSADPDRAAQIANAVADAYLSEQLDAKYQSAKRAGKWLAERIQELREQTSKADRSVADFKVEYKIVDVGGRPTSEQQVADLNSQLLTARTQTTEARAKLDRIEQIVRSNAREATVTDTLRSEVVSKLRSQYLDIGNREADISSRYGASHLAAVNLRNQMREISRSIKAELSRLAETYKSDLEIAKQREDEVQTALDEAIEKSKNTRQAQVQLKELESNSQIYRSLYESMLQRNAEAIQQQSNPLTEARIISTASRPFKRSHPSTILTLFVGLTSGLMLGVGLGIMRDITDQTFHGPTQVNTQLGIECLAMLPYATRQSTAFAPDKDNFLPRTIAPNSAASWCFMNDPNTAYFNGISSLKLKMDSVRVAETASIVGITSALPNEGKSTIALSLALQAAKAGAPTLLIDGDLRKRSLSSHMCVNANVGLLEAATGSVDLDDVVWKDTASGLDLLPVVYTEPLADPTSALASEFMKLFIEKLSIKYEYIIIDLPSLLLNTDVQTSLPYIQSYILAIEWGSTRASEILAAMSSAHFVSDQIAGVVLNKVDLERVGYYNDRSWNAH